MAINKSNSNNHICDVQLIPSIDEQSNIPIQSSKTTTRLLGGVFICVKGSALAAPMTLLTLIFLLWVKSNTEYFSGVYQTSVNAVLKHSTSKDIEPRSSKQMVLNHNVLFIDSLKVNLSQKNQSYINSLLESCERLDSQVSLNSVQTIYEIKVKCHLDEKQVTTTFQSPGYILPEQNETFYSYKLSFTPERVKFYTKDSDKLVSTVLVSQTPTKPEKLESLNQIVSWYFQSLLRESNDVIR